VFLILTSLACAAIGFVLPMAPILSSAIGGAFFAGALATAGVLLGMGLSGAILTRLEARASLAPLAANEGKRPRK